MKKTIGLLLCILLLGVVPALALADTREESCVEDDPGGTNLASVDARGDADQMSGRLTARSCDDQQPDGHATFAGNASDGCGYITIEGDSSNDLDVWPLPPGSGGRDLDGYGAIAVDANNTDQPVSGTYDFTDGNTHYQPSCDTP